MIVGWFSERLTGANSPLSDLDRSFLLSSLFFAS